MDEDITIGIDIGTTQTAVSFLIKLRGESPTPILVTRWPDQTVGAVKIPSSIYYRNGNVVSFGERAEIDAVDGVGQLIRHFKLHLHPRRMRDAASLRDVPRGALAVQQAFPDAFEIQALPYGVDITQIYTDWLGYLVRAARGHYDTVRLGGASKWDALISSARFVVAIPNGWDETQQNILRQAIRRANLNTTAVLFVSEAEASVHYVLNLPMTSLKLKRGNTFVVCDAGGSTVDTTMYRIVDEEAVTLKEVRSADCLQRGGIYVSRSIQQKIESQLGMSEWRSDVPSIVKEFDSGLKTTFKGDAGDYGPQQIRFGRPRDNSPVHGVVRGYLVMKGQLIMDAFDVSVEPIIERLRRQVRDEAGVKASALVLVGGFGEAPYLQARLRAAFPDIPLVIPSEPGKKAVAEGTIAFWTNQQRVMARGAKFTFGITTRIPWQAGQPIQAGRTPFLSVEGDMQVSGVFSAIITKDTVTTTSDQDAGSHRFFHSFPNKKKINDRNMEVKLLSFDGPQAPYWSVDPNGAYAPGIRHVGTLSCSCPTPILRASAIPRQKKNGANGVYFDVSFQIKISFGGTTLRAFMELDNGHRGEVTYVPLGLGGA